MSSFVYFKFKSQKDPTRVTIDGPHTDVWNLKREIINISRLGDGTDFDLKIYKENSEEEYTDDTEIIPKDSTVLARRLPASAPGKGRAARYVSGKPPASAKPSAAARSSTAAIMDSAMTEEERLKAMLKMTDAQWQQKQEEMSHDTRINIAGGKPFSKKANVPEGEPPHGYVCFRCMQKGHWIQACPTNDDAAYDGKPRVKKTTGIPRSMLQKVDKSEIDNLDESQRQNVMITSDGEYVLAQADKKTWKKFQDQKNASDRAQQEVKGGNRELQDRGLECPIDKRLFVDPRKTPCCGTTYCFECIENALIESDLECPNCHTQNISLEHLEPDEDVKEKIKIYQQEKKQGVDSAPASVTGTPKPEQSDSPSRPQSHDGSKSPKSPGSVAGRKRSASESDDKLNDSLAVPAPSMKRQRSGDSNPDSPKLAAENSFASTNSSANMPTMPDMQSWMQQMQMPNMAFPQMPFMPNMPMPMNPMMNPMMAMNMPMPMNMMNGMNGMMPNFNNFQPNNNNNMQSNNFNQQKTNHANNGGGHWQNQQHGGRGNYNNRFNNKKHVSSFNKNNNSHSNAAAPSQQQQQQTPQGLANVPTGPKAMSSGPPAGVPTGPAAANKFSNQQRHQGKEEDNAYMRAPVNPQRAMNRNRGKQGMRTAEYKEL